MKRGLFELKIRDWTNSAQDALPCCGIKSGTHPGRGQKNAWLQEQSKLGLRARFALAPGGAPCGYIEYIPGEFAWRGVRAGGYLLVHCLWTFSKSAQGRGVASRLLSECVADATQAGLHGVAALTRKGPWLSGSGVYLKNGFVVAASAPPDYQLLVRKLNPAAPDPEFMNFAETSTKYGQGLTILRSRQCPHIAKFADDIAEAAQREFGLAPKVVEIKTCRQAQNAPTPYAVFAILYDGHILADHPISCTRFRNIMRPLAAGTSS